MAHFIFIAIPEVVRKKQPHNKKAGGKTDLFTVGDLH